MLKPSGGGEDGFPAGLSSGSSEPDSVLRVLFVEKDNLLDRRMMVAVKADHLVVVASGA